MAFIPIAQPDLTGNEKRYINEALDDGWISSSGRFLQRFESEFAAFCECKHAIACCNGTAALHVLLLAMGIGAGDEVIVPSLTFVSSVNAVTYTGATPILIDSESTYWNADPSVIEQAITPRTKAIMAVHLYGHPSNMVEICAIGKRHGIPVIEDAAEAHGAKVNGKMVGNLGLAAAFSFFGNKIITTGEGGMVTTDDDELATRIRLLRGQGMDPNRRYWFPIIGNNFRMTNLAAALGCAQLERTSELLALRKRISVGYHNRLGSQAGDLCIELPSQASWAEPVNWLYSIRVPKPLRDPLIYFLSEHQIETRPFFPPMHLLPIYSNPKFRQNRELSIAEELGATGINLPTYSALEEADINRVCDAVIQFLQESVELSANHL